MGRWSGNGAATPHVTSHQGAYDCIARTLIGPLCVQMHVFQSYPVGLQIEFIALSFGPRGPISLGVMRNSLPFYSRHDAAPARAHSTSLVSSTAVAVTNSQQ